MAQRSTPSRLPRTSMRYRRSARSGALYVRVVDDFPTTGTNKIVKRTLVRQKYRHDQCGADDLYVRDRGASEYRTFTADDEARLRATLEQAGRIRFWDL